MAVMNFPDNPTDQQVYNDYIWVASEGVWRSAVMVGAAPCGSIMPFAGATIPAGWLLCDGSDVSRTTYSSLFAALGGISSPWGLGNGSTTFNLPDLRTRVPVGKNGSGTFANLGAIGGAETMTLAEAHIAAHSHSFSATTSYNGDHNHAPPIAVTYGGNASNYRSVFATNSPFWSGGDWNNAVTTGGGHTHTLSGTTGSSGSGSAFGLLQPYAVVNYIIKFAAVVAATDTEIAVRMGQTEATVTAQAATVSSYSSRLTTVETKATTAETNISSLDKRGDFGAKQGPNAYISAYKVNFAKGYGFGTSLDWTTYAYGIKVNETGYYEVRAGQRGAENNYSALGLNGDRTSFETRAEGIWSHDHNGASGGGGWSESYFIGRLYANEIVTFGGPANNQNLGGGGYDGFLSVKRIR
jgi:microcystin-dependent protein